MLIDAMLYHNEWELLELRMAVLRDVVDWFVIIEGSHTFQGEPRSLEPMPLGPKVIRHWVDLPAKVENIWEREYTQRNAIIDGCAMLQPRDHDVIMMSDVDEIPDPSCLEELRQEAACGKTVCLRQIHSYYYLNTIVDEAWYGTRACTWKKLVKKAEDGTPPLQPQEMRNVSHPLKDEHVIGWGGWHFGWIGGNEAVRAKVKAFCHDNLNHPNLVSDAAQDEARRQMRTIHNDQELHQIGLGRLPEVIQKAPERYAHLLKP